MSARGRAVGHFAGGDRARGRAPPRRQLARGPPLGARRLDARRGSTRSRRQTRKIVEGLKAPVRVTVFMTSRRPALPAGQGAADPLPGAVAEDRGREPRPGAQPGPRGGARPGVRRSGRTRSSSARGTGRSTSRRTSSPSSTSPGMGMGGAPAIKAFKGEEAFTSAILAVTEDEAARSLLLDGARRGRPGLDRARAGLCGREAAAGAGQPDGRDLGARSARTTSRRTPTVVVCRAAHRVPRARERGRSRSTWPAAGASCSCSIRCCRARARRRPTAASAALPTSTGLKLGDDIVIDPANALRVVGAETVIANRYGNHPIVRSLAGEKLPVIFQLARSRGEGREAAGRASAETMLVETSPEGLGRDAT